MILKLHNLLQVIMSLVPHDKELYDISDMEAKDKTVVGILRRFAKEERGCYHRLHAALVLLLLVGKVGQRGMSISYVTKAGMLQQMDKLDASVLHFTLMDVILYYHAKDQRCIYLVQSLFKNDLIADHGISHFWSMVTITPEYVHTWQRICKTYRWYSEAASADVALHASLSGSFCESVIAQEVYIMRYSFYTKYKNAQVVLASN
jgi:hypothetical protein